MKIYNIPVFFGNSVLATFVIIEVMFVLRGVDRTGLISVMLVFKRSEKDEYEKRGHWLVTYYRCRFFKRSCKIHYVDFYLGNIVSSAQIYFLLHPSIGESLRIVCVAS